MLKKIDEIEFLEIIGQEESSLLIQKTTAEYYKCKPTYLVFINDKQQATVGFFLYGKKNTILHPNHYHYSFLWIKNNLQDKNSRVDFHKAIALLIKKYKTISFSLINFEDLRAFNKNNFTIEVRYTFLKKTNDGDYSYGIIKHYKRALSVFSLKFNENADFDLVFNNQYSFLKKQNIRLKTKDHLYNYLKLLNNRNLLMCFSIVDNQEQLMASGIVLIDKGLSTANFLFCNTVSGKAKSAVNAFMYIEVQKWLSLKGISNFDYMGANFENIAEFKHTLNPDLKPYFIVRYNALSNNIRKVVFTLKKIFKF